MKPNQITPGTELCGIVLHPAGHTRSPAMHNATFDALGINAIYLAFDVPPEALGAALEGMRSLGIRQLSVSLPHKSTIIEHLDDVDETARRIGAVNTVILKDGHLVGSNTDWIGAVRALERETKLAGKRAVVLGAGGSARALVHGLQERGARVQVLNRTLENARRLADSLGADHAGSLDDLPHIPYDVLINTTSVGLADDRSPIAPEWITADSVVMDAVYEPEQTRLLRDAADRGARTVTGKWMLVYQAVEQFAAWQGPLREDAETRVIEKMAEAFDAAASRN